VVAKLPLGLLKFRNIGEHRHGAAATRLVLVDQKPSVGSKLLFERSARVAVPRQARANPFFLVVKRLGHQVQVRDASYDVLLVRAGHE